MNNFRFIFNWKFLLVATALIIVLASIFYTYYFVKNVAEMERNTVENYIAAIELLNKNEELLAQNPNCEIDLSLAFNLIEDNKVPIIIVGQNGSIDGANNFGEENDSDDTFLKNELQKIQATQFKPLEVKTPYTLQYLYYKESQLIKLLRYYPLVMFLLVGAFILVGFIGLRSEKVSEQNRIWAGLAKETAHQLGTPISGIVAWLEHLKMTNEDNEEVMEIVNEINKDIERLDLVADRFSKIGSKPELKEHNINNLLIESLEYMSLRSPKRVHFDIPNKEPIFIAAINPPLFQWVIENLLRNALDASGSKGKIAGDILEDEQFVYVDISDTGKGIPPKEVGKIFKPGFTTKKRGWGLGLSLSQRIIENYHNGKIFVKESIVGEGTTFRIQLPKKK